MFLVDFKRLPSPDLRLSYGFVLFAYVFAMFLIDFDRLPAPDLRFSDGFPIVWDAMFGFVLFFVNFNRLPSLDLRFFLMVSYGFVWFLVLVECLWLILTVCPRQISSFPMVSVSFEMFLVDFNRLPFTGS